MANRYLCTVNFSTVTFKEVASYMASQLANGAVTYIFDAYSGRY